MRGVHGLILLTFALLVDNARRWPGLGVQSIDQTWLDFIRLLGLFGVCVVLVALARRLLTAVLLSQDSQPPRSSALSSTPEEPRGTDASALFDLLRKSSLFDAGWYLEQHPDVAAAGIDPVEHYVEAGAAEGRNPSRSFDTTWYLKTHPDVAEQGVNPLIHYVREGHQEGRAIAPAAQDTTPANATEDRRTVALSSTNDPASADLVRNSRLFDARWYLAQNIDVAVAGIDPVEHYLEAGAAEGRNPSRSFDTLWYLKSNPDVAAQGVNPLIHYIQDGMKEGRAPRS